jgi:hypothetical protein
MDITGIYLLMTAVAEAKKLLTYVLIGTVICRARGSLQYQPAQRDRDDKVLRFALIQLAQRYSRYG